MLTPPGMGGKYKVTGKSYPRLRQPRRGRRRLLITVTTGAVTAVLAWGTVQLVDIFGGGQPAAASAQSTHRACPQPGNTAGTPGATAAKVHFPKPGAVTVNVYNATTRGGLAQKTADELKKRGFKIGKVDNAPAKYDKKVKETALLISAQGGEGAASVVGTQIAGARSQAGAGESGKHDTVDLMIGNGFTKLTPAAEARKALATLGRTAPKPSSTC